MQGDEITLIPVAITDSLRDLESPQSYRLRSGASHGRQAPLSLFSLLQIPQEQEFHLPSHF